ncbi:unnamed protein product [Owenia fusiformis]|uniref:Uncharacterized protein n=1 Tax=Owenia fusiformis TaxID=6347 RepID=A0A8J1Y1H5_OWEFU|nr:unnamed protein product [Owenia fusiformis]
MGFLSLLVFLSVFGIGINALECDFELSECGWRNTATDDDFDWIPETGLDHTTRSSSGRLMKAYGEPGTEAWWISAMQQSQSTGKCMLFWMKTNGQANTVAVHIREQGSSKSTAVKTTMGTSSGDWFQAFSPIPATSSNFEVVLVAERSTVPDQTISIDDISILGEECNDATVKRLPSNGNIRLNGPVEQYVNFLYNVPSNAANLVTVEISVKPGQTILLRILDMDLSSSDSLKVIHPTKGTVLEEYTGRITDLENTTFAYNGNKLILLQFKSDLTSINNIWFYLTAVGCVAENVNFPGGVATTDSNGTIQAVTCDQGFEYNTTVVFPTPSLGCDVYTWSIPNNICIDTSTTTTVVPSTTTVAATTQMVTTTSEQPTTVSTVPSITTTREAITTAEQVTTATTTPSPSATTTASVSSSTTTSISPTTTRDTLITTCSVPPLIVNGYRSYTSTTLSSKVVYACNSGFVLDGSPEIVCLLNGLWSSTLPTCIRPPGYSSSTTESTTTPVARSTTDSPFATDNGGTMTDSDELIIIIGVAAGVAALALLCMLCICCCWCRMGRAAAKERMIKREPTPLDKSVFSKHMHMYAPRGRSLKTDLRNEMMGSEGRQSRMTEKLVRNGSMVPSIGSTQYGGKSNGSFVNGSTILDNRGLLQSKMSPHGSKKPPLDFVGITPPATARRTITSNGSQTAVRKIQKRARAATPQTSPVSTSTKSQIQKLQHQKQSSSSKKVTSVNKEQQAKTSYVKQNVTSTGSGPNAEKPKMLEEAVRQKVIQHQRYMNPTYNSNRFETKPAESNSTIETKLIGPQSPMEVRQIGPHSTIVSVSGGDGVLEIPQFDTTVNEATRTPISDMTHSTIVVENQAIDHEETQTKSQVASSSQLLKENNVTVHNETMETKQTKSKERKRVTISESTTDIDQSLKESTRPDRELHDDSAVKKALQPLDNIVSEAESDENIHAIYSSINRTTGIQSPTFGYVDHNSTSDNTVEELTVTNENITEFDVNTSVVSTTNDKTTEEARIDSDVKVEEINIREDTTFEDTRVDLDEKITREATHAIQTEIHSEQKEETRNDVTSVDEITVVEIENIGENDTLKTDVEASVSKEITLASTIVNEGEARDNQSESADQEDSDDDEGGVREDDDEDDDEDDLSSTTSETHGKYDFENVEYSKEERKEIIGDQHKEAIVIESETSVTTSEERILFETDTTSEIPIAVDSAEKVNDGDIPVLSGQRSVSDESSVVGSTRDERPASDDEDYIVSTKPSMFENQEAVNMASVEITDIDTLIQNTSSTHISPSSSLVNVNTDPVTREDIENANTNIHGSLNREPSSKSVNSDAISYTKSAEHVLEIAQSTLERKTKLNTAAKQEAEVEAVDIKPSKSDATYTVQNNSVNDGLEMPEMQVITTHNATAMPYTNTF